MLKNLLVQPHVKVSMGPGVTPSSRVEIIKRLICKAGLLKEIVRIISLDLRGSTGRIYTRESGLDSSIDVVEGISLHARLMFCRKRSSFLYLKRELKLSAHAIMGF